LLRVGGDQIRILACAPTNAATDLIALGLREAGTGQVLRLYAPSRVKALIPEELLPFAHTTGEHPVVPSLDQLLRYKVVVATCVSASMPYRLGAPQGHFSHIFIDEAGQAMEPEAMVAIKTMATPRTNIILSGDPKQLGPVIRSGPALELGLGQSYLERLMELKIYDVVQGHGVTQVLSVLFVFCEIMNIIHVAS
jgi:helicase MOV-10